VDSMSQCITSYATGSVSGGALIGGLVGYNDGGSITSCYAAGFVSGNLSVGGLLGSNQSGMVSSCFWDMQTSSWATSAGGTGKTTAEMKTRSTFTDAGWDFVDESTNGTTDVWRICADGVDYPRLSWEFSQSGDFDCPDGVALDDLLYLAVRWLATMPETMGAADATGNGVTDMEDLAVLASQWMREQ
jgi:hypothetical protein